MSLSSTLFLLAGKPRTGKSTAVQAVMRRMGEERCGGFYTEEIRDSQDRTGFRCVAASGESRIVASVGSPSELRIGRYGVDVDAFETIAIPAVRESLHAKQLTVIDEIGLMQMLSRPFRDLIEAIADAPRDHVILGTVCLDGHPVIDRAKRAAGGNLFELTPENRELLRDRVYRELLSALGSGDAEEGRGP